MSLHNAHSYISKLLKLFKCKKLRSSYNILLPLEYIDLIELSIKQEFFKSPFIFKSKEKQQTNKKRSDTKINKMLGPSRRDLED